MTTPHQDRLRGLLDLSAISPLTDEVRGQAIKRFQEIIDYFHDRDPDSESKYNRPNLIRLFYRYAISQKSKDHVLRTFFQAINLPMEGGSVDFSDDGSLLCLVLGFADHLVNGFLLPLRASTGKTPHPTPHYRSATMRSSSRDFVGTTDRLSILRGDCLTRDKHRCVISSAFDATKIMSRRTPEGLTLDDDGEPILDENFDHLEVAHILPHSLVHVASETEELSEAKKTALEILNMFDNDIAHLINGTDVDRPRNALTLTLSLHRYFGHFDIYFTPVPNQEYRYEIRTFLPIGLKRLLPVVKEFGLKADRTIEPPSPRLLAIHCALGHIMHLSGVGEYIDEILRSMEDETVKSDGSTNLGLMIRLRTLLAA